MSEGTIVTFYSYKGGVGRTFALANIGALLSLWGYKTLCVDWDLEAPGLHLYFKSWLNKSNHYGLTELLQSHVEGKKPDWQKYVTKVDLPYTKAPLYLMSAGLQDNTYIQRMQALNWTELYESHTLGNFLEELRGNWKEKLDFVLIDSRTGISDIGSICTVQLPDLLVLLLTANDQSLYGSLDVLQSIEQVHANLPLDRAKLWIMPVVSRFEGRVEYTLAQEWLAIFSKALAPIYTEWAHKDVTAADLLNFTRIPYVSYWSFGEKLPVIEKGTEDPEDIGFSLETLASLVARKFSHSDLLIKNRDSFVAFTKQGPIESSVLISSTPSDQPFALRLKGDLEAKGFTTQGICHEQQFDLASQENMLGQMIRTSQLILLIVSPDTWPANLVKEYRRIANRYERRLVFIWVAGDDRAALLPDAWGTIGTVDLIDARETQYEVAIDEIINRIEKGEPLSFPLELNLSELEPRNPYKGLQAFTATNARDFFGRERLIDELIDRLRHILTSERPGMATARMLSVIGPSGLGKSSLVLAGLLPRLQSGALPGSDDWVYLEPMVPGQHPLEALSLVFSSHFPAQSLKTIREDLEDESVRGLHLLATKLSIQQGVKVMLFVDQFEELFTQTDSANELHHFLDLLVTAITEPRGPVIVVLALRADFYDRPMHYPQLHQLIQAHQTPVLPMSISELREVIERPAALPDVRLTFEDNLVDDLLSEVQGQVGALPLLQFTLDQLFQRREGRQLTLSAYRELSGVKGALTRQAEAIYTTLPSEEHRRLTRALFLRLIDPGASEQEATGRRAALSKFLLLDPRETAIIHEVVEAFVSARLLITNNIAGTTTIEVGSTVLIREWARLKEWLSEAREDILLQQAISDDAEEWERRSRPRDRLYRGTQLKEAQAWAKRNIPSGDEVAFLRAASVRTLTTRILYFVIGISIVVLLLLLLLLFLNGPVT